METFSHVPPGFRFHPTDEELVDFYLRKKITSRRIDLDVIKDVDLYKIEPWDLQELCRIGTEEQNEWYFFSHKDKKYPTGTRTNRATAAGFWKATGRDKAIYSKHELIGMRKTLVFYKGRAPNGQKSDWIMHEYRLETDENGAPQEEGWVVCRVFKKRIATMRKVSEHESPIWYEDHVSFMSADHMESPKHQRPHHHQSNLTGSCHQYPYHGNYKKEMSNLQQEYHHIPPQQFLQLPFLESPKLPQLPAAAPPPTNMMVNPVSAYLHHHHHLSINNANGSTTLQSSSAALTNMEHLHQSDQEHVHLRSVYSYSSNDLNNEQAMDQLTDWRVLDKFVASQLSQDEISKESDYSNTTNTFTTSEDSSFMVKQMEKQDWE